MKHSLRGGWRAAHHSPATGALAHHDEDRAQGYIWLTIYMDIHILSTMRLVPDTFFTALAQPLRLRALLLLLQEGELCVCELSHALGVSQPMISRHLAHLREAGLASDRRQGLWVYYRLSDRLPAWARQCLTVTADGTVDNARYAKDRKALAAMPNRPGAVCCG